MAFKWFRDSDDKLYEPTAGSWQDVDVSADDDIPSSATGLIVAIVNTSADTAYAANVRAKGSTDDVKPSCRKQFIQYAFVKLDNDQKFQAYRADAAIEFYVRGYTTDKVTWFVNRPTGTHGNHVYATYDLSAHGVPANAVAIFNTDMQGIRPEEEAVTLALTLDWKYVMCATNADSTIDLRAGHSSIWYLVGYIAADDIVWRGSASDNLAGGATKATWTESDASAGVTADTRVVFGLMSGGWPGDYIGGLREKGSADDRLTWLAFSGNSPTPTGASTFVISGVDEAQKFQYYWTHASQTVERIGIYAFGYVEEADEPTAVELAGRSSTPTRSAATLNTEVSAAGRSITATRSGAEIDTTIAVAGRSATSSRADVALDITISLSGRSATGSRADATLSVTEAALVHFQYRKVGEEVWLETDPQPMSESGDFDALIEELDPDTDYEFRAVAVYGEDTVYGEILTFETEAAGAITLSGRSATSTRAAAELDTGIALSGRSSTGTRAATEISTDVALSGRSATGTRSEIELDTAVTLAGRSATATRSTAALTASITLTGRSATASRAAAELSTGITLAGRSATGSRATLDISGAIRLEGHSATGSRADATLATGVSLAADSRTDSRADAGLATGVALSGRSATDSRADATLSLPEIVTLAGRSATPSRADVRLDTNISLAGRSATSTRADVILHGEATAISGRSATETRSDATLDTSISLSARSATGSGSAIEVDAVVRLAGRSATATRADLVFALDWTQFYLTENRPDFTLAEIQPDFYLMATQPDFTLTESDIAEFYLTETLPDFYLTEVDPQ